MREKKYRIWDIETEQFFYWDITEPCPSCLTKEYIKEHAETFIGLQDKTGEEIYKGDILKLKNNLTGRTYFYEVIFLKTRFCRKRTTTRGSLLIENLVSLEEGAKYPPYEIVGDIYRNPEFMEEK